MGQIVARGKLRGALPAGEVFIPVLIPLGSGDGWQAAPCISRRVGSLQSSTLVRLRSISDSRQFFRLPRPKPTHFAYGAQRH
jgi:hypothetical protein